jgi:enoyl-CoA hydratase/carnithine racemase
MNSVSARIGIVNQAPARLEYGIATKDAEMNARIVTETAGRILRIAIDRPEAKNALSVAMYSDLAAALARAAADPAVRVVLLHGHAQVFTSGNDIADFMDAETAFTEDRPVLQFLRAISTAEKPIVAAVNGPAIGIGTTMLLHCDFVYAGEGARFQLPFVNLALLPEAASTLLLPAAVGYLRAAELMLLGEPFSSAKAREYGIVTQVVPDPETLDVARVVAAKLAAKPPAPVRLTKMLMKQSMAEGVSTRMREETRHFAERRTSPEAAEAFRAFFEKRAPDFSQFD